MTVRQEQDVLFSETPHASRNPSAREEPSPGRLRRALPVLAISGFLLLLCAIAVLVSALTLRVVQRDRGLVATALPSAAVAAGSTPTLAPTSEVTATPAVATTGSEALLFIYDENGFYAWNPGPDQIEAGGLTFEALDANGQPTGHRFDGQRWARFYPLIEAGNCNRSEILNATPQQPDQCRDYNAYVTPQTTDEMVFWIPQEGISHFRVLWENQEVGRCDAASGRCEVPLP